MTEAQCGNLSCCYREEGLSYIPKCYRSKREGKTQIHIQAVYTEKDKITTYINIIDPLILLSHTHTHTHTHTHKHTHTLACPYAHMHIYNCTYKHASVEAHTNTK